MHLLDVIEICENLQHMLTIYGLIASLSLYICGIIAIFF